MQACGATRPRTHDPGWECTGSGLIIVFTARFDLADVPVVLPARALDVIEPESWWELPVKPFTGGDHVHLTVPRRPPSFRGDSCVTWGSEAMSACVRWGSVA